MKQTNGAWSDREVVRNLLQVAGKVLNLHKACNETISVNADCETFRFAQVLSAGGLVVSEPCPDQRDEADWAGELIGTIW